MTSRNDVHFVAAQRKVLLATMFCYLFFYTGRQSFGFAIPGIEKELGLSKATLGWVSAALLWCYALGQVVNGNLGDRFGGRRMMSLGAFTSCGLNWVVSFGTGFWSLLIPWGLNGLAQSMGWAPGSRVLSNWWPAEKRGKVYGCYVFAAGLASVLAYVTSLMILQMELDWRWIFRLPVLLLLIGGFVYFVLVRDRPEDAGFSSSDVDGKPAASGDASSSAVSNARSAAYLDVLTNRRFMIASWAIGFQSVARYGLLVWVPVHFLGTDWKSDGKWISVALPVGMALGAIVSGWLSDRLFRGRRWPVITVFMGLAAVCSLAMGFIGRDQTTLALVVLFLCGFFVYGPQSAFWALCPDLLGVERSGTGTGIMNAHAYLFAGLGEPFIGAMIDAQPQATGDGSGTEIIFLLIAIFSAISAAISLFIRR